MEKEIIKLITVLIEDNLYKQVYASEIKMLFNMLRREQNNYLQDLSPLTPKQS